MKELGPGDLPRLQRFYEANPEYSWSVNGHAPGPDAARETFDFPIPFPYERKRLLGWFDEDGEMVAMADIAEGLFAPGIWHVGLFIVATSLHGKGNARAIYEELEGWMASQGACWLRLGVVEGNSRAEGFWQKMGYVETRKRHGVEMGEKVNTLRVMAKPLRGTLEELLEKVPRDRPDAP